MKVLIEKQREKLALQAEHDAPESSDDDIDDHERRKRELIEKVVTDIIEFTDNKKPSSGKRKKNEEHNNNEAQNIYNGALAVQTPVQVTGESRPKKSKSKKVNYDDDSDVIKLELHNAHSQKQVKALQHTLEEMHRERLESNQQLIAVLSQLNSTMAAVRDAYSSLTTRKKGKKD